MKKNLYLIIIILIFTLGLFIFLYYDNNDCSSKTRILKIDNKELNIEIADNDYLRSTGLSNHKILNSNEGLLFIFEDELIPKFWMKDMLFPINIIWINSDYIITGYEENISPATFPKTFSPVKKIKYVLEVGTNSDLKINDILNKKINIECNR